MRKRFKRRKKHNIKTILFLIIIIFIYFLFYINKLNLIKLDSSYINYFLKDINNSNISKLFSNNNTVFNRPIVFLENELEYKINEKIETVVKEETKPLVYIYNSHPNEEYSKEYLEEHNIIPTVYTAATMLSEKLNNLAINTIVESNIANYMNENNLNHAESYIASRYYLEKIMKEYDNIDLFIDLHRDSIPHNLSYININSKNYAKVLFVIGLQNPNYNKNLSLVETLNTNINNKYPNLSRGILKKEGAFVNGIYNQDLNENVILIELGGYQNNIEEINNTLDILSIILKEHLYEKKEI